MTKTNLVRASRDGDCFHYLWAARRCLLLLSPTATLKAVTIEGPSVSEVDNAEPILTGEELIDVGEYYGSENLEQAILIKYIQVKHSTVRTNQAWTPSELEKTLKGFAARYGDLQQRLSTINLSGKLEFAFVSNRPINADFLDTIHDAAEGVLTTRHAKNLMKLEKFTSLSGTALESFCKLLRLDSSQEGLWDQQNLLAQDFSQYLVEADMDAPVQLKELVTKKALSVSENNPTITRMDVLRALKTDGDRLFPAVCLITDLENAVSREQEPDLFQSIVQANGIPIIIHAAAGVGKSIFATRIKLGLPDGSISILYDCFGNGQYRSVSKYRHRHKDALVQIANELAANGLCHPLIPTPHADPSAYVRAFIYRLQQSIDSLRSKNPLALLCVIIDAADNAQIAAEENGETRSFVCDLVREQLPGGVRLIALCRTHRQQSFDPPPDALRLELRPFSRTETAAHLRQVFADANEQDIDEFHHLSSQNPRVQALALEQKLPLREILRALGLNPTTVEGTIEKLLETAIARLRYEAGTVEKMQIDKICAGLAILRPLIPLSVLASISGVDEAAIRSFAYDLKRPLLVTGNAIQFLDEPAETWFRDKFQPTVANLKTFVASIKPLASSSAYVASVLPQLMLEAGQFAGLVALALSSEALPSTSPVEKRDIEVQRLQFALKASLRAKHYTEAAKLALKAGGESAGDERQRKLIQANTDLAATFLKSDSIQALVSRRTFNSGWIGSHHAYEAALLSEKEELLGDASSRLRMAGEWLNNWSKLSSEDREKQKMSDDDILAMAIASFKIYGANSCAHELRRWTSRAVSFRVGRLLAKQFIDHGRYTDLDLLAVAAGNDLGLTLAITLELREVHREPPKSVVERSFHLVLHSLVKLNPSDHWDSEGILIRAVTALVEATYKLSIGTTDQLIAFLTRYLPASPPRSLASRFDRQRFPLLRAYALRAALGGQSLDLIDLAQDELRKELESPKPYSESQDAREFKDTIAPLLPWFHLWASTFIGQISSTDLANAIIETKAASTKTERYSYQEMSDISNEIARIWFDTLLTAKTTDAASLDTFEQWIDSLGRPLFTTTLTHLARLAARTTRLEERALDYVGKAFDLIRNARDNAESKSDSYVDLARAILTVSKSDAEAYFGQAVEVASKIGDENLDRWGALLELANRAASRDRPNPEIAYRLARCAELTYEYNDQYFDWEATVEAISGLCGKSSLAIISRWRDRDFGWAERILPIAVNFLVARGDLDPKVALALTGFRVEWNEILLLKNVLETCANKAEKEVAMELVYRNMTLDGQSFRSWRELKSILCDNGIKLLDIDERIILSEREEQSSQTKERKNLAVDLEINDKRDWNTIFEDIDLSVANDISRAHRRLRDSGPPYSSDRFFAEACQRVHVGKEAEFIAAISVVAEFELYHLRCFLKQIPETWRSRFAVKQALAQTLKTFSRRFCMEITTNRRYETLPLKSACELCGIHEGDVVDVVLTAYGETTDVVGASKLFTLVGLLALKLEKNEASEALSFGLDLFDPVIKDSDGDGPWSSNIEPPNEIEGSVAGYIWGCLAAPRASLRWEAAHVVCALCTLGDRKVIEQLVKLANGASCVAFYDAHLHFYKLHARQWLLIGLARAAKDQPKLIAPYADFLIQLAFAGEPHVLIREFAKRALLALLDAGDLDSQADLRHRLATVNVSPFPSVESKSYGHFENEETDDEDKTDTKDDDDRFYFGIDMGPYWFAPLGRCFGKSQTSIEREVLRVIRNDWQLSGGMRWDEDERHRRKIFKEMQTHHSHGSYPRVDELRFYVSYHAMMVVAGKLLATAPVHHDPDDSEGEFHNWLRHHGPSRQDGGWLADRRDPIPLERPTWKDEEDADNWHQSLAKDDFDRVLMSPDVRMNLWGRWTWVSGQREESIHVYSALVSPERSLSLLRALQCADNSHDFRIPDADDDLQIDFEGFQLKGWIGDRSCEKGIDEQDPWAGAIMYPPPEPAAYIIDLMKLNSDSEHRRWCITGLCSAVSWSQVWGHFQEKHDDETIYESGDRFQASFDFVVSLLQELEMDLIVEVEIKRRRHYYRWERSNTNDGGFIPPSARLFLIKADGSISTL